MSRLAWAIENWREHIIEEIQEGPVLDGRVCAISAHLLPRMDDFSVRIRSSSADHEPLCIDGSK
jgi:hypothetical protein